MRKILIIDDQEEGNSYRIEQLETQTPTNLIEYIEFETNLKQVIEFGNGQDEIKWLIKPDNYEHLFIHNSYKNSIFPSNTMNTMLSQVEDDKIVFFSGGSDNAYTARNESEAAHYIVKRHVFYNNFNSFMEKSFQLNDYLSIDFFVNGKYEYAKYLKEYIHFLLEDSIVIALNSKEIRIIFILANYPNEYIDNKIKELLMQDESSIIDFLEDLINKI